MVRLKKSTLDRVIDILLLTVSLMAFSSAIWIVVPAPAGFIWLLAIAASEWSIWIAIFAFPGIVLGLFRLIFRRAGKATAVALGMAATAFVISLYPLAGTLSVARVNNVELSLSRYFAGVTNLTASRRNEQPATHRFLSIDGRELMLDVYRPTEITDNNGASVIVVHGGSWSSGGRGDFAQWNQRLAEMGFTVFDIDYRTTPQPNYLTATGDVKCSMSWVQRNAAEFNISPERIAIMGRSAGAHLALLAAYSNDDDRLPSSCPESDRNGKVRAVVSMYAPVELLWAYDNPANESVINGKQTLANFLGGSPHDSADIRQRFLLASPTSHINPATPPTLIIHGGQDQLVRLENLTFLGQRLSEFNVLHQTLIFPYAQHGYDYNFNGWGSQVTEKVMLEFLVKNTKAE